jgi:isopentenyl diphosphate isomerase/L-lactate dehydrogenase-like FMN-dependent dehydrogenase
MFGLAAGLAKRSRLLCHAAMRQFHTIDQLRAAARRRLPRFAFDFIDGGAGRETALDANTARLRALKLVPRVLQGCEGRAGLAASLFGRPWAAPLGMAPMGLPALAWPGADLAMARAAKAADVPFVLSTPASAAIEEVVAVNPDAWFQLYVGRDGNITELLLERAEAAGIRVLVLTVDVPVPGRRVRDLDNRFGMAFNPGPGDIAQMLAHPRWSLATALSGGPRFANLERYGTGKRGGTAFANLVTGQPSRHRRLDWTYLADLRRRWKGVLVVKGVLHPDDAVRAVAMGAEGVVVSNHGGRQLDTVAPSIEMLPLVREAVGDRAAVLFDSGVRAGEDIAKALALGADFVFAGRAFLYGLAAIGPAGAERALAILLDELDRALPQLGCLDPAALSAQHVRV